MQTTVATLVPPEKRGWYKRLETSIDMAVTTTTGSIPPAGSEAAPRVAVVAFPTALPGVFDYLVPACFSAGISRGTPVLVPLRNRELWGVVVELKESSPFSALKPILEMQQTQLGGGDSLLKLYEWVAEYYQCSLGRVFRPLMRKGVVAAQPKTVQVYAPGAAADADALNEKYRTVVQKLMPLGEFTAVQAAGTAGVSRSELAYLVKKNFLVRSLRTVSREAIEMRGDAPAETVDLTDEQVRAVDTVMAGFGAPATPYLLFGITGSGKTHVYIELVRRTLERGRGAIILVPEIALTPQTIQRFRGALGDIMTVIHSHMSDGERRDSLQELVTGRKRMVIGVRSAIMAPVEACGLIIVDEEHDGSYKQSDCEPRYNARDVAVMRGRLQKALVVLGSATPSFESYHNAITGKYGLLPLVQRFGAAALPRVELVDMKDEHAANNWQPLSRRLSGAIASTVEQGRQVILLLNRRGFSTVLLCKECGFTAHCPNCSVTLRYHRADTALKCHICGHYEMAPVACPGCGGSNIKYKGTGIQKIEEVIKETLPGVRLLRMDQDTTRRKGAHADFLKQFADRKADILLGTQMVAKGLNFPGVALVGVIAADTGLHLPDFRAAERTFQLLTQVAGRAGRADCCGEVIIQTYCPEECALQYVITHDYRAFFEQENPGRKALGYPPWGRLVRIIATGHTPEVVEQFMETIAAELRSMVGPTITMLGPAPAVLERVAGEARYGLLIKSTKVRQLGEALRQLREKFRKPPPSVGFVVDVDPVNML